jgi:hypothetical protein
MRDLTSIHQGRNPETVSLIPVMKMRDTMKNLDKSTVQLGVFIVQ